MSDAHFPSYGKQETVRDSAVGAGAGSVENLLPADAFETGSLKRAPGPCCPHCHQPLSAIAPGEPAAACPHCGGSFRLESAGKSLTTEEVRRLGRFELLLCVGQGTFGSVWRARDTELKRIVALKVPHAGSLTSSRDVERCVREAQAAASLRHPNIVCLHDTVTVDGLPILVSDFIDGVTLKELIEVQRLPFRDAAALVAEVAEALEYAHTRGLVHRDIKPGNLLVEPAPSVARSDRPNGETSVGKPVIVDFGLALREEAEIVMTMEGQIIGTPAYMSPEQAAGKGHKADRRSDVYSLGVVLYELLTGAPPFRGSKLMLLRQVMREDPRPPRRVNDRIPRDLETVCLKAMAKEPGRRYQTAGAFAEDLRRFLCGQAVLARPVSQLEKARRWYFRNWTVTLPSTLFVVTLVAGLATMFYYEERARKGELEAKRQTGLAEEFSLQAREQAELSDHRRYAAEINRAREAWTAGNIALTEELLAAQEPPTAARELRGFEWYYLRKLCHLELEAFPGVGAVDRGLAFSPDGRWVASTGADHSIVLRDLSGRDEAFYLSGHRQSVFALAFSPRGQYLASVARDSALTAATAPGEVKVWDLKQRTEAFAPSADRGAMNAVAFSVDGRFLAYGGGIFRDGVGVRGTIHVWDMDAHRPAFELSDCGGEVQTLAFSPDSRYLASAGNDSKVRLWSAAGSSAPEIIISEHVDPVNALAFSPDSRHLASAGLDRVVLITGVAAPHVSRRIPGHEAAVLSVAFSRDGLHLASAGFDRVVRIWETATGREERVFRGHSGRICAVAFSPDGWRLASVGEDQTVKLWDMAGGRLPSTLFGRSQDTSMALSPDGKVLATANQDRTVKLWDLETGLMSDTWWGHLTQITGVAFSPDGSHLASASKDGMIRIWAFPEGRCVRILPGHTSIISALAFSPRGDQLVSASADKTIKIWDWTTDKEPRSILCQDADVTCISYSANGQFLACGDAEGHVTVWDPYAGNVRIKLQHAHRSGVFAVALDRSGDRLASCGADRALILWDLTTGKPLHTMRGHSGEVRALAFSPDGERLVSAGFDQTVRFWDTRIGQQTLSLEGSGRIGCLAYSRDGSRIAANGNAGTTTVWDARPWGTDTVEQRPAVGLLDYSFRTYDSMSEVVPLLQRDPTITESARKRALTRIRQYEQELVHQLADTQLIFYRTLPQLDLLERIRSQPGLNDAVRQRALVLGERYVEDPKSQDDESWATVRQSRRDRAADELALRRAEAANRLVPNDNAFRVTLGMARYRVGDFDGAVSVLREADGTIGTTDRAVAPARLAFLAMSQFKRGNLSDGQAVLHELQEMVRQPQWQSNPDAKNFLQEATTVINSK